MESVNLTKITVVNGQEAFELNIPKTHKGKLSLGFWARCTTLRTNACISSPLENIDRCSLPSHTHLVITGRNPMGVVPNCLQLSWKTEYKNLSCIRYLRAILDIFQVDLSQDSRIVKLQEEEFKNCKAQPIKRN